MSQERGESRVAAVRSRVSRDVVTGSLPVGLSTLYMVVLFVTPMALLIVISFWTTEQYQLQPDFVLDNYRYILGSSAHQTLLGRSIGLAFAVTAFCLLVGYPIAYYISRGLDEQQLPVLLLFAAPFFVGTMMRESAHQAMTGPSGLVNQLLMAIGIGSLDAFSYGYFQVFLGEVYLWFPFMLLPIFLSLEFIDETLTEAAIDSGASSWVAFKEVTWPMSLPGVAVGVMLVFISTLVSHVPSQFVGGPSARLIGNNVYNLFGEAGSYPRGAALGVLLMVLSVLFVALVTAWTVRRVPTIMGGEGE